MKNLVLWGHDLQDYREMFALSDHDLSGSILEYCSGPTAFNCQMRALKHDVVSYDRLFNLEWSELKEKALHKFEEMLEAVMQNEQSFHWGEYKNPQNFAKMRRKNMDAFFDDIATDPKHHRYVGFKSMPLPSNDFAFDLALCSHYLFANDPTQDKSFHLDAIVELTRVAKECRIFPLCDREGQISTLIGPLLMELNQLNLGVEVRQVPYQLQDNGNAMLRVWAKQCDVPE